MRARAFGARRREQGSNHLLQGLLLLLDLELRQELLQERDGVCAGGCVSWSPVSRRDRSQLSQASVCKEYAPCGWFSASSATSRFSKIWTSYLRSARVHVRQWGSEATIDAQERVERSVHSHACLYM